MKTINNLCLAVFLLFASQFTYAQYTVPGSVTNNTMTVKQINENASALDKSEKIIQIKGYVIRQINEDTYIFKDNTGELTVDINPDELPSAPFDEHTEVIIIGEIDYNVLDGIEFEADA